MKKTIIAAALAALTFTALSSASHAAPVRADIAKPAVTSNVEQVRDYRQRGEYRRHEERRGLSERQVIRNLYRMGYDQPRIVGYQRNAYIVNAIGRRGGVQLVVSKRDGDVISRTALHRSHKRDHHYGYRKGGHRTGFTVYFGNR